MNLNFKTIWLFKYNYIMILIIAIIVIAALTMFLYQYFYKTISQTNIIALLKSEVVGDSVKTKDFEEVQENIADKKAGSPNILTPAEEKWVNLRDPFANY